MDFARCVFDDSESIPAYCEVPGKLGEHNGVESPIGKLSDGTNVKFWQEGTLRETSVEGGAYPINLYASEEGKIRCRMSAIFYSRGGSLLHCDDTFLDNPTSEIEVREGRGVQKADGKVLFSANQHLSHPREIPELPGYFSAADYCGDSCHDAVAEYYPNGRFKSGLVAKKEKRANGKPVAPEDLDYHTYVELNSDGVVIKKVVSSPADSPHGALTLVMAVNLVNDSDDSEIDMLRPDPFRESEFTDMRVLYGKKECFSVEKDSDGKIFRYTLGPHCFVYVRAFGAIKW
jgi:hypothetical protein